MGDINGGTYTVETITTTTTTTSTSTAREGIVAQPVDSDGSPLEGAKVTMQCRMRCNIYI